MGGVKRMVIGQRNSLTFGSLCGSTATATAFAMRCLLPDASSVLARRMHSEISRGSLLLGNETTWFSSIGPSGFAWLLEGDAAGGGRP